MKMIILLVGEVSHRITFMLCSRSQSHRHQIRFHQKDIYRKSASHRLARWVVTLPYWMIAKADLRAFPKLWQVNIKLYLWHH